MSKMQTNRLKNTSSLLTSLVAAKQIVDFGLTRYNDFKNRRDYYVFVYEDDDLFPAVEKWVLNSIPVTEQRSIGVHYKRHKNLHLRYSGTKEHEIRLSGHKVRFSLSEPEDKTDGGKSDYSDLIKQHRPRTLTFRAESLGGKQAVLGLLEKLSKETDQEIDPPKIKRFQWGEWYGRKEVPQRSIESVVLKDGQMERILTDLNHFRSSKDRYDKIGMSWHRGYLFHGPPGTGKSSLAMALAHYLQLDLNCLPLGDIKTDSELNRLVAATEGILLLEDVDVFSSTVDSRDSEKDNVSLSGLLNSLDGVITPDGLITIMTTNDITALDPALIRSGRIDLIEELGLLDHDQLERLFFQIYGVPLRNANLNAKISPSDMTEIFKTTEDPAEARKLVRKKIKNA